jgi:NADH:ubiquinone oxidoreductase subunit 5 (subunit L)/multisubunit Na+/H+ antiporter MnhA subunit
MLRHFLFGKNSELIDFGPLFNMPGLSGHLPVYVDNISYGFSLLTSLIGLFVFVYAFSYMRFERSVLSFLALLKAFELSMILLVLAGS